MIPLWCEISDVILVVVRNPLLQYESRLKSIVDRYTQQHRASPLHVRTEL